MLRRCCAHGVVQDDGSNHSSSYGDSRITLRCLQLEVAKIVIRAVWLGLAPVNIVVTVACAQQ